MRELALLDAPSNLGLRPPAEGAVPGCYKAPGVLRDAGLLTRLGAHDAGVVTAARYLPDWIPGQVRNEAAIAEHSLLLADRVGGLIDGGRTPVVLGGDCSILVGLALALRRRGRFGLVSLDGLDYRHPGNSDNVGAAGGESLAMVTGLGGLLADLEGLGPSLMTQDVVAIGLRPDDECAQEAAAAGMHLIDSREATDDPDAAVRRALDVVARPELDGFWIHCDADVLDPSVMPAVDSPEPGGLGFDHLAALLAGLVASPRFTGLDLTIYDPDIDPGHQGGRRLADVLTEAFTGTTKQARG